MLFPADYFTSLFPVTDNDDLIQLI